ncbi:MAG: diaminopimelate epimerase [Candidatus Omnitrophota bacterium]|nr:diaminopimelate epimerase [Candidatus Omnitrophota bacterium]
MKTIDFTKMVASGNDFIVINNLKKKISGLHNLAKKACDRNFGLGADGLLVIEPSKKADFKMRIINSDGSEAEMCGNGARCAALYAKENHLAGKKMRLETLADIIGAEVLGDKIRLKMSDPKDMRLDIDLTIDGKDYSVNFVNTGVPHAVVFVGKIDGCDVKSLGRRIRYHSAFAHRGTNADFVEPQKGDLLKVRTYERGVEDETLACGTGVVASAVIAAAVKGFRSPVKCLTKSGEILKVYFKKSGDTFKDVYLEGSAKKVFCGRYILN